MSKKIFNIKKEEKKIEIEKLKEDFKNLSLFENVKTEKDLNNLKRFITKNDILYQEILKIRNENNKKNNNGTIKTIVQKIFNLENKAHEKGKTKTPTNGEILVFFENRLKEKQENLNEERIKELRQLLKRLKIRSSSGVAVVSLLTKPYPCPGRCIYCPTEVRMPKSYLSKEPAAARALANNFDPYKQINSRLKALENNGHPINKLEIIVIGGTFDYYKKDYQEWFIKEIFRAANNFNKNLKTDFNSDKSLAELQKENETTDCRIIGLSTETRPDYINFETLNWLRYLGITKIEIGVQHLDQHVLDFTKREMSVSSIAEATEKMRSVGFKFVYHMMPNLPESTPEMDVKMFKDLYNSKNFHPDMMKIYPCMILKSSLLYKMFVKKENKDGTDFNYQPYNDELLVRVLADCEREVKNYTRLIRIIRDIPATYILASSKKSNMREMVDAYQKQNGFIQQDIRAREIREMEVEEKDFQLRTTIYETNHGKEYFLEYINKKENDKIAGFCRLRLQDDFYDTELKKMENLKVLADKTALIRELHVYGIVRKFGEKGDQSQHIGFGTKLMQEAERLAKENNYKKMAVISGIGVREYYKNKLGYHEEGTYMVKVI